MVKKIASMLPIFLVLVVSGCASSSSSVQREMPKGPYYEGNAGKNIRFTVLEPKGIDIGPGEQWLLPLAQGTLTSDFKTFSAMNVLDRQNLDKILENQQWGASGYFSDEDYVQIGHLTNAQYILVGTITKIPNNSFLVNFSISDSSTGELKASFPPTTCTINQLQDTSILKNASETLLKQMGVTLTDAGKNALHISNTNSIGAETALAKGITAQKGGNVGQALSYYYNAVAFEPSLAEAKGRLSIVSNNVSTGNIGENARNLIAYRNAWRKTLDECDAFLSEHSLFEIKYNPDIKQTGTINFHQESLDISMKITIKPRGLFDMINDVKKGLKRTKKEEEWGFETWPFGRNKDDVAEMNRIIQDNRYDSNKDRGAFSTLSLVPISGRGSEISDFFTYTSPYLSYTGTDFGISYNISIALINDTGVVIATNDNSYIFGKAGSVTLGNTKSNIRPISTEFDIIFRNVDVNKITDNTTVKIISINGRDAELAGQTGYIKITTGKL